MLLNCYRIQYGNKISREGKFTAVHSEGESCPALLGTSISDRRSISRMIQDRVAGLCIDGVISSTIGCPVNIH